MTTLWTTPTQLEQYAESGAETVHIPWEDNVVSSTQTVGELEHIARSPKHDIKNKTYFIRMTGFEFQNLPNTLSGIEVRLNARRYGRATDETISLCLDSKDIGKNRATLDVLPEKIYGSSNDLWDVEDIDISKIQDPTFGVIIRFQAHPHWPHRSPVQVDSVEVRIH